MIKKKTKSKPDLTTRNAKAYNKKFVKLEAKLKALEKRLALAESYLKHLLRFTNC